MTFESAAWLWAIPLITLVSMLSVLRYRRLRPGLERLVTQPSPKPGRSFGRRLALTEAAFWLTGCALSLALADFRGFERTVWEYRTGLDLVFALDISRSMDAKDIEPSRLRRATELMLFVAENAGRIRTAVVLGKGEAVLALPLTDRLDCLKALASTVTSASYSATGSNLESLLRVSSRAFSDSSAARRLLVVLSDGESLSGTPEKALSALRQAAVQTVFIGLGSSQGAPVPLADGSFLLDNEGHLITSRLHDSELRQLADQTAGVLLQAASNKLEAELLAIIKQASRTEASAVKQSLSVDLYPYFLSTALIFYYLSLVAGIFGRRSHPL